MSNIIKIFLYQGRSRHQIFRGGGSGFTKAATTVSKEAAPWLVPTRQRKFWIFDLLDWLKAYLFLKISLGKNNQK